MESARLCTLPSMQSMPMQGTFPSIMSLRSLRTSSATAAWLRRSNGNSLQGLKFSRLAWTWLPTACGLDLAALLTALLCFTDSMLLLITWLAVCCQASTTSTLSQYVLVETRESNLAVTFESIRTSTIRTSTHIPDTRVLGGHGSILLWTAKRYVRPWNRGATSATFRAQLTLFFWNLQKRFIHRINIFKNCGLRHGIEGNLANAFWDLGRREFILVQCCSSDSDKFLLESYAYCDARESHSKSSSAWVAPIISAAFIYGAKGAGKGRKFSGGGDSKDSAGWQFFPWIWTAASCEIPSSRQICDSFR